MREVENNLITVYVKKAGEDAQEITLEKLSTVADALEKAGFSTDAEVKYDGRFAKPTWQLEGGEELIVSTGKVTQG